MTTAAKLPYIYAVRTMFDFINKVIYEHEIHVVIDAFTEVYREPARCITVRLHTTPIVG